LAISGGRKKNPENLATLAHFFQKILLGIALDIIFFHQVPLPKKRLLLYPSNTIILFYGVFWQP
jgi:hypothetical protein